MGVGGQCHSMATWSPGKTWYPLYGRLCGPQGQSGWVRKILPPMGFIPWTVQPVVSHYTDYAILAHRKYKQPSTKLHSATSHIPEGCSHNKLKYEINLNEVWEVRFCLTENTSQLHYQGSMLLRYSHSLFGESHTNMRYNVSAVSEC
jgi:hypothetical protein